MYAQGSMFCKAEALFFLKYIIIITCFSWNNVYVSSHHVFYRQFLNSYVFFFQAEKFLCALGVVLENQGKPYLEFRLRI